MKTYIVKPAEKADISVLLHRLGELKIPFQDLNEKQSRIIRIGPDAECEVRLLERRSGRISKVTISIRYGHPIILGVVTDWVDHCGLEAPEEFWKWPPGLSPSILRAIQATWRIDLTEQVVTPLRFHKHVLVFMFSENKSQWVATQLSGLPHKWMGKEEFIRCEEWGTSGDDPLDVEVYRWSRDADIQLLVTVSTAPATTLLCLWIVPKGAPVEISIDEMPNKISKGSTRDS